MGPFRFFLIGFLFFNLNLWAQRGLSPDERDVRLCTNLEPLICDSERRTDSTGVHKGFLGLKQKMHEKQEAIHKVYSLKIAAILRDPDEGYFRRHILKGLGAIEGCEKPESLVSDPCNSTYSERLSYTSLALMADDRPLTMEPDVLGSYESLSAVFDHDRFAKLQRETQKNFLSFSHDPDYEKKIENEIFPATKKAMIARLETLPIKDEDRSILIDKIKGVKFGGFDCEDLKQEYSEFQTAYLPNAYYDPKNKLNVCRGLSSVVQSEAALTIVMAHELGHALDPCILASDSLFEGKLDKKSRHLRKLDQMTLYPDVIKCLRSSESIKAKRVIRQKKTPRIHCAVEEGEFDQAQEAFADWLAAETAAEYFKNKKPAIHPYDARLALVNMARSLNYSKICSMSDAEVTKRYSRDVHPSPRDRIHKIYLAQPEIRKALRCDEKASQAKYCEFKSENAVTKASLKPERKVQK